MLGLVSFIALFEYTARLIYNGKKDPLLLMKTSHKWFFLICVFFDFCIRILVMILFFLVLLLGVYFCVKAKIH